MSKIKNSLVSLVAAGAISLSASGCANYFRGATPGMEIGNEVVEKNCSTYSLENISIGDTDLYHLGFTSKKGGIEHGFYRREHSHREIDPSCQGTPSIKSDEQRNRKKGMYFLVSSVEKGEEATITLKEKFDVPEPERKEKTSVLSLGREVQKGYNLNELFKNNRMRLPGDKHHSYFVFPFSELTDESIKKFNSTSTGDESPEYLPVYLVDTRALLVIDNKTGRASFVDKDKKQNKIKVLKFYTENEAKGLLGYQGR